MEDKSIFLDGSQISEIINRDKLKFDEDKKCSISLSGEHLNICMICGECFSGCSMDSPIVKHFMDTFHSFAFSYDKKKLIIIPTFIEIPEYIDFKDIIFSSSPKYDDQTITEMITKRKEGYSFDSKLFFPGGLMIGNSNLNHSQKASLRFLSAIDPLRNHFLLSKPHNRYSFLVSRFFRYLFSPFPVNQYVFIDELLVYIEDISKKQFIHDEEVDPLQFITFILNSLGKDSLCLKNSLRGVLEINEKDDNTNNWVKKQTNFWSLPIEYDDSPLYRSGIEKENIIPHVHLTELLKRFDGDMITVKNIEGRALYRKMKIISSPEYLWINVNRFKKNTFNIEKRNMHLHIPQENLDMEQYGINTKYELVSVIGHEGNLEDGEYVAYVNNMDANTWTKFESNRIEPALIQYAILSPCCHLLFKKK